MEGNRKTGKGTLRDFQISGKILSKVQKPLRKRLEEKMPGAIRTARNFSSRFHHLAAYSFTLAGNGETAFF
jgi:hypothetical protein